MWIFYFSVTQNQTQISSKTRRILKIAIPKLSKEILKYANHYIIFRVYHSLKVSYYYLFFKDCCKVSVFI